jgi:heptosyltransferase-3
MSQRTVLCFIAARNFGDIALSASAFRELAGRGFAEDIIVWTRAPMGFLFEGIPNCTVVYSSFPVGTFNKRSVREILGFLREAMEVRRMRPTISLDMVGDFRERLFARLICSRQHLHIGWSPDHPYQGIIRNPFGHGHPSLVVGPETPNVYAGYARFVDALLRAAGLSDSPGPQLVARERSGPVTVGLHPSASQECKVWPAADWVLLTQQLLAYGIDLVAFGAESERSSLESMFAPFGAQVRISTGSIPEFAQELAQLDVLVGLDSFSVHMAENVGTPSVMLVGPNDPVLFAPPRATVISSSGGCAAWPCFNRPTCQGTAGEYVCIRSITFERVRDAVLEKLVQVRGSGWRVVHAG